jgi:homoserine kinase
MACWKQVTEGDDSAVLVNMDNITHIKRAKEDQTTTIFFVSGAGSEVYVLVNESPEEILMKQPIGGYS